MTSGQNKDKDRYYKIQDKKDPNTKTKTDNVQVSPLFYGTGGTTTTGYWGWGLNTRQLLLVFRTRREEQRKQTLVFGKGKEANIETHARMQDKTKIKQHQTKTKQNKTRQRK